MPAGKMYRSKAYKKRKLPRIPYKKKRRVVKRRAKFQQGLRSNQPITRRKLNMTCLHQYQNDMAVSIPNWNLFQQNNPGLKTLVQSFNLSSPQIFDDGGKSGGATGNNGYINYGKTVSDVWSTTGTATMFPGYVSYPIANQQFNHIQVLGSEYTFKIRVIPQGIPDTALTTIPIKVFLVATSDQGTADASLDTSEWESLPYVQTRIIEGQRSPNNQTCVIKYRHSNRKFNGVPKGQYISDGRYLAASNVNQSTSPQGNTANEQDHLKLVFAPLSINYAANLPASTLPPNIFVEMKVKRWIRYTDPNTQNLQYGTGLSATNL